MKITEMTEAQLESTITRTRRLALDAQAMGRSQAADNLFARCDVLEAELEKRDHKSRKAFYGWNK